GTPVAIGIRVVDQFNQRTAGYHGTVRVTSTDPTFTPFDYTFDPGTDLGEHTFTVTLKTASAPAVWSLSITDTSNSALGAGLPIEVHPAAASRIELDGLPPTLTAGVSQAFHVTAFDPFGNLVADFAHSVH